MDISSAASILDNTVIYVCVLVAIILLSMTLHEAMHAFMGYWLGDDTARLEGRLTLNPVKHIDPFLTLILPITLAIIGAPIFGGAKPVPFNPTRLRFGEWGAALVAIAGPITNFLIAFISFGLVVLIGDNLSLTSLGDVLMMVVYVNLGFFIFNMLPIPPLDGSRVIYALAPEFVRRGMEYVERLGILLVAFIVLLASPVISVFMTNAITFFISLFSKILTV